MEILVIGLIYVGAFTVFALIVLKGYDPGPFATYSAAILTALIPFLRGSKKTTEDKPAREDPEP